jgi:hypothetical protein
MGDTQEAKVDMSVQAEMPSRSLSKELRPTRSSTDVTVELAHERRQISERLEWLERAIEANPEGVSDHHKELWRKQAEAMRTYKEVLGERIKDLIDN